MSQFEALLSSLGFYCRSDYLGKTFVYRHGKLVIVNSYRGSPGYYEIGLGGPCPFYSYNFDMGTIASQRYRTQIDLSEGQMLAHFQSIFARATGPPPGFIL